MQYNVALNLQNSNLAINSSLRMREHLLCSSQGECLKHRLHPRSIVPSESLAGASPYSVVIICFNTLSGDASFFHFSLAKLRIKDCQLFSSLYFITIFFCIFLQLGGIVPFYVNFSLRNKNYFLKFKYLVSEVIFAKQSEKNLIIQII